MSDGYSIWVLEYSHVLEYPESGIVYGQHNKGTRKMPYGYVFLKGNDRNIMVDVGFDNAAYGGELARQFGVIAWQSPSVVLEEIGVAPEDIDTVIVTHAHFDHFGNVSAFPNATFYLQERELTKWVWALTLPREQQYFSIGIDPDDVLRGVELAKNGRLKTVSGDVHDLLPGINVWAAHDTHTFGCMFVDVQAGDDEDTRFVLAGDNVYAYENLEGVEKDGVYRPVGLSINTANGVFTLAQMMDLVGGRVKQIIPVHENRLPDVFPSRETKHGLHVTEVHLREGDKSYVA
ncbi:N-acyl homoserine lactonase family protein [Jatrophihabitans lederbergiae]|uniref:N-acyl homoserine lactonase family protein n=1 Tax=Jatrophihabitans lederbergiae TaxID=3075547 RepID=A0ABU2JCQ4_9ACTN|nr:N-acyl homoserine lactonase family protein [Jatrophihabitans sp. DSM 44399]MDT0262765.1 N-acyl homoserine lactonase family protein [Jatrophihabitans sp. DSM 44399]